MQRQQYYREGGRPAGSPRLLRCVLQAWKTRTMSVGPRQCSMTDIPIKNYSFQSYEDPEQMAVTEKIRLALTARRTYQNRDF